MEVRKEGSLEVSTQIDLSVVYKHSGLSTALKKLAMAMGGCREEGSSRLWLFDNDVLEQVGRYVTGIDSLMYQHRVSSSFRPSLSVSLNIPVSVLNETCMVSDRLSRTEPEQKWVFKRGKGITSSPAIGSDGTVYVGSDDENLYAINSEG